jgi:hypothetical protein
MSTEPIDFAAIIEPVARHLLGEPNHKLSNGKQLRFGSQGSVAVEIGGDKKGTWYDHERGMGGGTVDLLCFQKNLITPDAIRWLEEHSFIPKREREQPTPRFNIVKRYGYKDSDGTLLFHVARLDPKDFRQQAPNGTWKTAHIKKVPYRLPELLAAPKTTTVYIVEGEKDVDALRQQLLVATCNPGGAGKWRHDYSAHFAGRPVVVLSDNDPQATDTDGKPRFHPDGRPVFPGQDHAAEVAKNLRGIAASVRVLMLPNLPTKGDVSDWLAAGGSAEELERLASEAPEQEPASEPSAPLWIDAGAWNEADIPKRPWIVQGYLLRNAVTVLSGPPSAFKSSLMLGWACAIVLNREYGRFKPNVHGNVVVYNVEDDEDEQRRRLSAVLRQFNASPSDIAGKLIRVGPRNVGTLLARDEGRNIVFTDAMNALEDVIKFYKPVACMNDPLAELHTEEENDNVSLRAVIAEFRAQAASHGMANCIAHHTRKGSNNSPGDPDIARGASSIIGAARVAFTTMGMSEADAQALGVPTDMAARAAFIRLDYAKSNYAPLRDAEWFEKFPYVLANGEAVPAAVPWTPPAAKVASQSDIAALATAIEKGTASGEPWSPKLSKEPRSVSGLLGEFGFFGDAQKKVLQRLQTECSLGTGKWKSASQRHPRAGLRIEGKPAVKWVDDAEEGE